MSCLRRACADVFDSVSDDGNDDSDDAAEPASQPLAFPVVDEDELSASSFHVTRSQGFVPHSLASALQRGVASGNGGDDDASFAVSSFVHGYDAGVDTAVDGAARNAPVPTSPLRDPLLTSRPPPSFGPAVSLAEVSGAHLRV